MASHLTENCQPPPLKRSRGEHEEPKSNLIYPGSSTETPLNDSNTFNCLDAPSITHGESWFLPSSELDIRSSLDDPGDSGISDGATPPASCDDSQDSFPVPATTTASGSGVFLASSSTFDEHRTSGEGFNRPEHGLLFESSSDLATLNEHVDLNISSDILHDGNSRETEHSEEDDADDDDQISTISGLSDLSGSDWKPNAGPFSWVQRQMMSGANPRTLLQDLIDGDAEIPDHLDQLTLWKIILNMVCEPPRRKKLPNVNTLDDVVNLIRNSKKILVLTGAGVSVSCGIPDFRSRDGVYARLAVDFPDLPDPQAMFDIHYFRKNPRPFFKFAREIYPGQFQPSPCHRFIKCLENHGTLLRNYTQNIDTLEQVVGLSRVVQCHGSFATATCMRCRHKVEADAIKNDIFQQKIPYCPVCTKNCPSTEMYSSNSSLSREDYIKAHNADAATSDTLDAVAVELDPAHPHIIGPGCSTKHEEENPLDAMDPPILKPDIVFFGENLGDEFHNSVSKDKNEVDLLIMIGSSLKVRPVALIPSSIEQQVPQILINREPLSHLTPDVELLGDCDGIINEICLRLGEGWEDPVHKENLSEAREFTSEPVSTNECSEKMRRSIAQRLPEGKFCFVPPNRYVFPGAEVVDDSDDDTTNSTRSNFGDSAEDEETETEAAPLPSDSTTQSETSLIQSDHKESVGSD